MKKCYTCQTQKNESDFNKNKVRKDGLNSICKDCNKARSKQYYKENLIKHKKEVRKRKIKHLKNIQKQILEYLEKNPCVKCGEDDILVLEFDHLRDKKLEITSMIRNTLSWNTIREEINKCQVLCANCHKRKTAEQFSTYRWKYVMGPKL